MSGRRIVANLDFERALAASPGRAPRRLSPTAGRRATLLGTLARVFASEGDRLWLPAPLPPGRIAAVPVVPRPECEKGELGRLPPAADWLAWGETESIAALRSRDARARRTDARRADESDPGAPLWIRAWGIPHPVPAAARHIHHRQTHAAIAEELGLALPGQRWITTIEALDEHLASGAATIAPGERWILKPPFSAAGRDWLRGEGPKPSTHLRNQIEKALGESHGFLFEPRFDRTRDVGVSLAVHETGVEVVGRHELENSANGRFLGARPLPPVGSGPEDEFADRAVAAALRVGDRVHALGFRGACGIDAWLGRDASGEPIAQLLGEINARFTFGWVTHAWRGRLVSAGALEASARVRLRIADDVRPPEGALLLVAPAADDALAAWLEIGTEAPGGGLATRGGTR